MIPDRALFKRTVIAPLVAFVCLAVLGSLTVLGLLALSSDPCGAQEPPASSAPSIGLDVGLFSPLGKWKEHRYAPVDQFGRGIQLGGELELDTGEIHFVLFLSYARLDVDDWVRFAAEAGDQINASAAMYTFGGLFRAYLLRSSRHFLHLDLGAGYVQFRSEETFGEHTYEYDFLTDRLGICTGLGYKFLLTPRLALSITGRPILLLEGVRYPDGEKMDVFGLSVCTGIRLLL